MNYDDILSKRASSLEFSGIRKFFDIAATMSDVISLSVGEPDFKTPFIIREKAIEVLENGRTRYTSNSGTIELKNAISSYQRNLINIEYDPKSEIIVTVGGSEAVDLSVRALVNFGDEVLIPEPSFVCYAPIVKLAGGIPIIIETTESDEFKLTPTALKEKITDKTKALVLSYPNNPTGAVLTKKELEAIGLILKETNIITISDEIYAELTYDGIHSSIASLDGFKERTLVINGFSKAFAMTGWRLGYVCGPREIIEQVLKIHQYAIMCAPTISQAAAVVALTSKEVETEVANMVKKYDERRRLCLRELDNLGLKCFEARGAFYVFPSIKHTGLSSEDFCLRLLNEKKVAIVPGSAFGKSGEGYVRISYAYSKKHLNKAFERIEEFLNESL